MVLKKGRWRIGYHWIFLRSYTFFQYLFMLLIYLVLLLEVTLKTIDLVVFEVAFQDGHNLPVPGPLRWGTVALRDRCVAGPLRCGTVDLNEEVPQRSRSGHGQSTAVTFNRKNHSIKKDNLYYKKKWWTNEF